MLILAILFDHFQFTLTHGPNIPGFYAMLFLTASDFTFITSHIHNWALFLLWLRLFIFLELFGNGIPAELFQILKDDAGKVLHSKCQQIWKTQQ